MEIHNIIAADSGHRFCITATCLWPTIRMAFAVQQWRQAAHRDALWLVIFRLDPCELLNANALQFVGRKGWIFDHIRKQIERQSKIWLYRAQAGNRPVKRRPHAHVGPELLFGFGDLGRR